MGLQGVQPNIMKLKKSVCLVSRGREEPPCSDMLASKKELWSEKPQSVVKHEGRAGAARACAHCAVTSSAIHLCG